MSLDCSACKKSLPRGSFTNAQIKTLKVARKCKDCEKNITANTRQGKPLDTPQTDQLFAKLKLKNQIKIKEFDNCGIFHGDVLDLICRFLVRYPRTLLSMSQVCTLWQKSALEDGLWKAVLDRRSWQIGIPMAIYAREKYKVKFLDEALWLRTQPKGEAMQDIFASHLISIEGSNLIYGINASGIVQINPEIPQNYLKTLPVFLACDHLLYSDPYFVFLLNANTSQSQPISSWNRKEPKAVKIDLKYELGSKTYLNNNYFTLSIQRDYYIELEVWDLEKKKPVISEQYQIIHSIANDKMWYWLCYSESDLVLLKGIEIGSSMAEHIIPLPHPLQFQCSGDKLYCHDEGHFIVKQITLDPQGHIELVDLLNITVASFESPQIQILLEHNLVVLWEDNGILNVVDMEKKKTIFQTGVHVLNKILHCDRLKLLYLTTEDEQEIVKIWNLKTGKLISTYKTEQKYAAAFKDNYLLLLKKTKSKYYNAQYQIWRFYFESHSQ